MSSRRIPDPGSLIAGITFAGIGLIFLVGDVELADRARWVWPIVLVGLGAGLLAAVLRRPADAAADGPAASPAAADTAAFPAAEPSTPPPWTEPAAVAGPPYQPLGEPEPEGGLRGTGTAEDSPADEPELVEGGAAEPDQVEGGAAGQRPEGRERS
jgi:hypothetical protein